jgi:carbonic anhydrase
MDHLTRLLKNNREWSESVRASTPEFFQKLSQQQSPRFLWIGCSDSRVPANQITGLMPGEIFVQRNIANVVDNNDPNLCAVVEFAVDVLQVEHIIVCGHYGCGGVAAVLSGDPPGHVSRWLAPIRDVARRHITELEALDPTRAARRLCELNVERGVRELARSETINAAWQRRANLTLHGWIYSIEDGLLKDLHVSQDARGVEVYPEPSR